MVMTQKKIAQKKNRTNPVREAAVAWAHATLTPEQAAIFAASEVDDDDAETWMHLVADAGAGPHIAERMKVRAMAAALLGLHERADDNAVIAAISKLRSERASARNAETAVLGCSGVTASAEIHDMTIGDLVAGMATGHTDDDNPAAPLLDTVATLLSLLQMAEEVDGGISDTFRNRAMFQIQNLAQYGAELTRRVARVRDLAVEQKGAA
jgi:hypothetical protein